MRHVEIHSFVSDIDTQEVFDKLADLRHYAKYVEGVVSVDMEWQSDREAISHWVVKFRKGLLRWTEEDWFYPEELRLEFNQTKGDFKLFKGHWQITPEQGGARVSLIVDFDFGVASLACIVDPVGERVLTDQTKETLQGLFGAKVSFLEEAKRKKMFAW